MLWLLVTKLIYLRLQSCTEHKRQELYVIAAESLHLKHLNEWTKQERKGSSETRDSSWCKQKEFWRLALWWTRCLSTALKNQHQKMRHHHWRRNNTKRAMQFTVRLALLSSLHQERRDEIITERTNLTERAMFCSSESIDLRDNYQFITFTNVK